MFMVTPSLMNQTLSSGWRLLIGDHKHPLRKGVEHFHCMVCSTDSQSLQSDPKANQLNLIGVSQIEPHTIWGLVMQHNIKNISVIATSKPSSLSSVKHSIVIHTYPLDGRQSFAKEILRIKFLE